MSIYKPGDWYENESVAGYIREDGSLCVCVEKSLSDADCDNYSVQVQNGEGYYNDFGRYVSYGHLED